MILPVVTGLVTAYVAFRIYWRWDLGICTSRRDLRGRTVIVTGANTGIGFETAKDLAFRNARVILACRSPDRGKAAASEITQTTGNPNVVVKVLDLASLKSIRTFAKDILESEERLDVLVNNAGKSERYKTLTEDGLEETMATNHLGLFLLTNLLLPLLKKSAPSRIVVVSSLLHQWCDIDFDNLNSERSYSMHTAYSVSKLSNVLFTRELSKRLKGTGVTVNVLHPGAVKTDVFRQINRVLFVFLVIVLRGFYKSAKEGAQTTIYVAVAEELEGVSGKYFSDCREAKLKPPAMDANNAKRLWEYSEKVTGLIP